MKTVLLVILGIAVLAGVALGARRLLPPDLTVFDKGRWVAEVQAKPSENKRSLMTKDLEKRLRQGLSEEEIVALMGQPDSRRDNRFIYNLGMPGFGVDYDHYVIEFDANRKVTRYFTDRG